jgi:hypothetical protein
VEQQDQTVVVAFILVLLGISYLIAVATFVREYLLVAGLAYAAVAVALVWRVAR